MKLNEAFFPTPASKEDIPSPAPDGFREHFEEVVQSEIAEQLHAPPPRDSVGGEMSVTKGYDTWGPKGLTRNPFRIPFWPVIVGLALFVGLQTIYSIPFLLKAIADNPEILTETSDPSSLQSQIQTDAMSTWLVVGSLILGWSSFLFAVWLGSRNYIGGWKSLTLWRFSWKRDLIIAGVVVVSIRTFEVIFGVFLKNAGYNQDELSNSKFLEDFTGPTLVFVLLGAAIVAPIVEELFFRGLFMRSVMDKAWVVNTLNFGDKLKNKNVTIAVIVGFCVAAFTLTMGAFAVSGFSSEEVTGNGGGVMGSPYWPLVYAVAVFLGTLFGVLYYAAMKTPQRKSAFAGVVISSVVFGIMHTQATGASSFYTIAFTTAIGAILGGLFLATGRLGTAVLAHLFLNSSAVILFVISLTLDAAAS